MSTPVKDGDFRTAVESLETCLMTPRVPGELVGWVDAVQTALKNVGKALTPQIECEHHALFEQITSEDPELHTRIDSIKAGDEQSQSELNTLQDRVTALQKGVPQVEPDEARLETELRSFIESGLSFVLHLRKQEVAIDTWFKEAFNRVRGIGD